MKVTVPLTKTEIRFIKSSSALSYEAPGALSTAMRLFRKEKTIAVSSEPIGEIELSPHEAKRIERYRALSPFEREIVRLFVHRLSDLSKSIEYYREKIIKLEDELAELKKQQHVYQFPAQLAAGRG